MEMVIMTEPVSDPQEPIRLSGKGMKTGYLVSETENGSENGSEKKIGKSPCTTPQIRINDEDLLGSRKKLPQSGPRIYESELSPDMKNEMKLERKKSNAGQFSKSNAQYHKLFKDVPKEEMLIESFTCALQKDLLYQGKLYISTNWVCFHSKVFGKDTKLVIPVITIALIKKTKTALLVPNALVIATITERFIFVSLLSRDTTYKLLKSICSHLESTSTGNSPNPSPAEHGFRGEHPSQFPLDFNVDFSELDGLVKQRRIEIEGCSSSGSQTGESENSQEFQSPAKNVINSHQTPISTEVISKQSQQRIKSSEHQNGPWYIFLHADVWKVLSVKSLLCLYAVIVFFLLLSTLYMQSRIEYLEDRLTLMDKFKDYALNILSVEQGFEGWPVNVNSICGELSDNLEKLEQIQRNLKKLLEDSD
ncbi:hypothetical protein GDO86_002148 [Hymenochirus boettgeri]|uniref:GRAM domain-containing protein n=1 Tax=Hymenochirus boettgeri TaxID=247094 RepID=A0A8T2KLA8_9PIPI|nr:hypothetical protein GDO86_002148 [Hymenochirus boettgeri]